MIPENDFFKKFKKRAWEEFWKNIPATIYMICTFVGVQVTTRLYETVKSLSNKLDKIELVEKRVVAVENKLTADSVAIVEIHTREQQTKEIITNNKAETELHLAGIFVSISDLKAFNHLR